MLQPFVIILFDALTLFNFIILCADGFLNETTVTDINQVMTLLLLGEIALKIAGFGMKKFT